MCVYVQHVGHNPAPAKEHSLGIMAVYIHIAYSTPIKSSHIRVNSFFLGRASYRKLVVADLLTCSRDIKITKIHRGRGPKWQLGKIMFFTVSTDGY